MRLIYLLGLMLLALPQCAVAGVVLQEDAPNQFKIQTDGKPLAVFQRFEDIWLVSNDPSADLALDAPPALLKKIGLTEAEPLQVRHGKGLRLSFESPVAAKLAAGEKGFTLTLGENSETPPALTVDSIITRDQVVFQAKQGGLVRATSLATRESYVVLPVSSISGYAKAADMGPVRALKTMMGGAYVSVAGLPLAVANKPGQQTLRPVTDALSQAVAQRQNPAPVKLVEDLLAQAGVGAPAAAPVPVTAEPKPSGPRRPQLNDYKIHLPPQSADPEASYNKALDTLQQALTSISGVATPTATEQAAPTGVLAGKEASAGGVLPPAVERELQKHEQENAPAAPSAVAESAFLPDFGDISRHDVAALEQRLRDRFVAAKTPAERDAVTLRQAGLKMYLQQYPEAIGLVRNMTLNKTTGLPVQNDGGLILAAAQTLMGRNDDALKTLAALPQPSKDRAIWKAAALQGVGRNDEAAALFADNIEQLHQYPAEAAQELYYRYAQVLFATGKLNEAMAQIDHLAALGGRSIVLPMAQLLMARIYAAQQQDAIAEQIFVTLAGNPDKMVSSHALFYYLKFLTDRGELKPDAAAIRFDNLRYMWRGDEIERESLWYLGNLYEKDHQNRKALERFKALAVHFPESPRAKQATAEMTKLFGKVFLNGDVDRTLDDLGVLGLYYDFRELTPPGREGDKLINSIVVRLKKLGLNRRAIKLLEDQLQFRLKDADTRAEAGLQLAGLYYQDFNPQAGLTALQHTAPAKGAHIPDELENKRQVMKARLLYQGRELPAALDVLGKVKGPEADLLRAEIAWETGDKATVEKSLEGRFNGADGSNWTTEDGAAFMRYAMVLSSLGERAKLGDLAVRYNDGIVKQNLEPYVQYLLTLTPGKSADPEAEAAVTPPQLSGVWGHAIEATNANKSFAERYKKLRIGWASQNESARQTEQDAMGQ